MRVCSAAIVFLTSIPVLAAPPSGPPVHMLVRDCEGVVETEVERVIAADLGAEISPSDQTQDPTWIIARCVGSRVVIEVTDGISRKTLKRSFDLGVAPAQARGRLIAIAASELVLAGWAELSVRPKLRVEPEGDPPSAEQVRAAVLRTQRVLSNEQWPREQVPVTEPEAERSSEREARPERQGLFSVQPAERRLFRIMPLASLRGFFDHEGLLKGGGLRLGEERLLRTSWAVDALVESGTIDSFQIDNYSLAAHLYLYAGTRYATLRGGAGLRAGLATAAQQAPTEDMPPPEPSSSPVPWGWPMLAFSLTLGARGGPVLEFSGEGGYVTLPVSAGRYGVSIRGAWFGFQLGLGFAP